MVDSTMSMLVALRLRATKLNANLSSHLRTRAESMFKEYIYIFAFSSKDLRDIPEHVATHRIELDPTISQTLQARYRMNLNHAKAMENNLE